MPSTSIAQRFLLLIMISAIALTIYSSWNGDPYPSFKVIDSTIPINSTQHVDHFTSTKMDDASICNSSLRVTHFVMTKVEKTGSSTLFGIFSRFVLQNQGMNILLSQPNDHVSWILPSGKGWSIGPRPKQRADVLINHARYNKTMFDKYLVKDIKYIVPVREPESWLQSAVGYYSRWSKIHMTAEELVMSKSAFLKPRDQENSMKLGSWYHLVQLQWLGFDYKHRNNVTAIQEHVDYIVSKIDMPILLEQFEGSLVILRKRFCWDYTEIFYQKYMVQEEKVRRKALSTAARKVLFSPKRNLGEKLLYDRINRMWWSQPELNEMGFWDEVEYFKKLNYNVSNVWCPEVMESGDSRTIAANHWHGNISITWNLCRYLQKTRDCMMRYLRQYASNNQCV